MLLHSDITNIDSSPMASERETACYDKMLILRIVARDRQMTPMLMLLGHPRTTLNKIHAYSFKRTSPLNLALQLAHPKKQPYPFPCKHNNHTVPQGSS